MGILREKERMTVGKAAGERVDREAREKGEDRDLPEGVGRWGERGSEKGNESVGSGFKKKTFYE